MRARLREAYVDAAVEASGLQAAVEARLAGPGRCGKPSCKRAREQLEELQGVAQRPATVARLQPDARSRGDLAELERRCEVLERERDESRYRRMTAQHARAAVEATAAEAAGLQGALEKAEAATRRALAAAAAAEKREATAVAAERRSTAALESAQGSAREQRISERKQRERVKELERELEEAQQERTQLEQQLRESESVVSEQEAELERLRGRSEELRRTRIAASNTGMKYQRRRPPTPAAPPPAAPPPAPAPATAPGKRLRPHRNSDERAMYEREYLAEVVGEGRDADVLALALEDTDSIDGLMETVPFQKRVVAVVQGVVDTLEAHWNAALAVRIKCDYLLSNRDLDGLRIDFSFDIVKGRPRQKLLYASPGGEVVRWPEVIPPRTSSKRRVGWQSVVDAQREEFGIEMNPAHHDAAERDFMVHASLAF